MLVFQVRNTLFKVIIPSSSSFAANIMISFFSVAALVLRIRVWRVYHGIYMCALDLPLTACVHRGSASFGLNVWATH